MSGDFALVKLGVRDLSDKEKFLAPSNKGCTIPSVSDFGGKEKIIIGRALKTVFGPAARSKPYNPLQVYERDAPVDQDSCPTLWWSPPFDASAWTSVIGKKSAVAGE